MKDEERICGLYLRVSTEDKAKEGFSLPEQKERLEALCKFKGYKIYDYYTDAGISAKTGNYRPEFDRLIEDAKNKKINTIIALKLDRLSRSICDWENLLKTSEKYEFDLVCPIGYKRVDKKLVPDPLTKDIVIRIFNLYFEGNSYSTIANVSNNEKKDLACEIIIELGDKEYWDTKDDEFKSRMSEVYRKQVNDLELLVPNFKVGSAIIHYDETSPHMHIVGVPIKYKNKNGMEKQVGKSDVFTKEYLITLQNKMRTLCIEEFNQEYNLDSTLKKKQKGRNMDIHVSDMDNYIALKKQLEKNNENLEKANKKSLELKQNSKDIKDKIDKLKTLKLNKDNYILSKSDKDLFINFINQVDNTNKEYDKIQNLSNTLTNTDEQFKEKDKTIKTLTENNKELTLRVKILNNNINEKDNKISFLKSKISSLRNTIDYWKNKFDKLISFLHSKLHNWYDKYIDVVNDMYEDNVLDNDDIKDLKLSKEKDDFER